MNSISIGSILSWFIPAVFTICVTIIGYFIKKFLDDTKLEQKEAKLEQINNTSATKELTQSNLLLSERLSQFKLQCEKIETVNTKRLDDHAASLKTLDKNVTRIDGKLEEHANQIKEIKTKIDK